MFSLVSKWLSSQARSGRPSRRRVPPRYRLTLERLEDRTVPSTLTVTSLNDTGVITPGDGTLRGEILAAAPSGDTIVFDPSLSGIIQLDPAKTALLILKSLTINGPGAGIIEVSGTPTTRVFDIMAPFTDLISGLTIEHGHAAGVGYPDDAGGGIRNAGNLTLQADAFIANTGGLGGGFANILPGTAFVSGCTFTGNSATASGGGMANNGRDFTVQNSELSDNDAAFGGGIANFATAKVQGSSFCMNTASSAGGGIYNLRTLTVDNSYFSSNASAYLGGAIANDTTGSATVTDNTSVDSNHAGTAGGGISNLGSLDLSNSTISNNFTTVPTIPTVVVGTGGGIYNTGTLTVESNSCLYGNSANFGGGIFNSGTATVMDSFVTCNSANVEGGGIDNFGPASVLYVTNSFVENNTAPAGTGQDLHNDGSATLSSSDVDDIQTDLGGNTTVTSPRGD